MKDVLLAASDAHDVTQRTRRDNLDSDLAGRIELLAEGAHPHGERASERRSGDPRAAGPRSSAGSAPGWPSDYAAGVPRSCRASPGATCGRPAAPRPTAWSGTCPCPPEHRERALTTDFESPSLRTARAHADVGLPVERGARFRLLKRIVYRVSWVFLRHQVALNHALLDELAILREERAATLAALDNRFDLALRQVFDELRDHVARSADEHVRLAQELSELSSRMEPLSPLVPVVEDLAERVAREASAMHLARAEAAIVVERVRRALPPSNLELREDLPSAWDDLYLPFEDVFRGSAELIRSRLSVYLPDVAGLDRGDRPVVDVGCGPGDWLAVLAAEDIRAYGVDSNLRSVERAQALGLDARHGDAFAHLAGVPAGSLAAVTAFHLVEHVTTEQLVELLDLAYRALMPGGLVILETPNPDNFMVGTSNFYLDPTHRNPLPPPLLAFLVGSRGFRDTSVRPLRRGTLEPAPPSALAALDPAVAAIIELLQEHLLAGEDYAVLAYR